MNFSNISILVVDDNENMVTLLQAMLTAFGTEQLKVAYSAQDALKIMRKWTPDLIITDWRMKPMGGYEFVKLMRSESNYPECFIPIIVVSAYSEITRVKEAQAVGVNQFLVKPVSPESLYRRIMWTIQHPFQFRLVDGRYVPVFDSSAQDKTLEGHKVKDDESFVWDIDDEKDDGGITYN
ncbi:response regulator [Emcibacter sp.]|uniref:response regulator n=1 Tax=Emcibacter sp. TaxID=1979954 RepID=UPI002AA6ABA6|nr:response regulator [Emcibacter sp.]